MIPFHKVVIIGAGISGLTSAVYLQRSGFRTLVLEKAGGPGGAWLCQTVQEQADKGFVGRRGGAGH